MSTLNIYQRIAAVMEDIQYLAKDDKIEYGNTKYRAISEEKVTREVRKSLIKHGIVIIPVKQEHSRNLTLTTVNVTYRIQNIENPDDFIEAMSSGTGVDTQDKGVGKAMTYAYKYLMLRTFAIPTGDDPDKISSAQLDDEQAKRESQKIDAEQIIAISELAESVGAETDKIFAHYKIDKFKDMTQKQWLEAMQTLESKRSVK